MVDPPLEQKIARFEKALKEAIEAKDFSPAQWENSCETIFSEIRVSCIHLRRETDVLDKVENKVQAWGFISKFCRARPFQHDRCKEVVQILMKSDSWMRSFGKEADHDLADLPQGITEEFSKRYQEVNDQPAPTDGRPPPDRKRNSVKSGRSEFAPGARGQATPDARVSGALKPKNLAVVVQRCSKARILVDERMQWWGEIGRGLVVSVSFSKGADEESMSHAAHFLLTAKLSTAEKYELGSRQMSGRKPEAESVVNLCAQGEEQGILVLPQESLCSGVNDKSLDLSYDGVCPEEAANGLYKVFVEALRRVASDLIRKQAKSGGSKAREPKVVSGSFQNRQYMEMTSAGPFMHAFNF